MAFQYTSEAGIEEPEQKWPMTATTFMPATLFAAVTACFGSHASSSTTRLTFMPMTPPAAFRSFTAISAPRFICIPNGASLPVIGPITAIDTSFISACAAVASATADTAASARMGILRIVLALPCPLKIHGPADVFSPKPIPIRAAGGDISRPARIGTRDAFLLTAYSAPVLRQERGPVRS